jgi:hypothetical protein
VSKRAVLTLEPRFVVVQRLLIQQPAEDVLDNIRVGMKFGNGSPDILFTAISKEIKLGLIGPQDSAVRPDPV